MARIEKTIFISYRRTDVYTALAVYENLKNQGYDVFFDYRSISSGDFEQIITSNIKARAHFLLILTPTALDRLNEPGDWLRREIEIAIDEQRNIVPLFFKGFRFGTHDVSEKLTGKLRSLSSYNGLNIHEDYFEEAMQRVRMQFLSKPLDTVLHPVSTEVRKVVREEQIAADKALKERKVVKEPVKRAEEKPDKSKVAQVQDLLQNTGAKIGTSKLKSLSFPSNWKSVASELNFRQIVGITGGILLTIFFIWGIPYILNYPPGTGPEPTRTLKPAATQTSQPTATRTSQPTATRTVVITNTPSIPPTQLPSSNNPQEEPVSVWNDIPIMPQAIKAHESDDEEDYSFTIDATPQEARDYYHEQLLNLGWVEISIISAGGDNGYLMLYEDKDGIRLVIIISNEEDELLLVTLGYPYRGMPQ